MSLPKISAYCATYGRPKVLEEAVESFLKQDYTGEKEIIILNDFKDHKLYFDHPQVKIFNLEKRIFPLGKKFNEVANLCTGEIIFAWEDDDIYLPNRVSLTVSRLLAESKKIFHTRQAYVEASEKKLMNSIEYWKTSVLFHSNLAMYKDVFKKCGGYTEIDEIDLDSRSIEKFFKIQNYKSEKINQNEIFYIYRINTNSYHATCLSYEDKKNISFLAEQYVKKENKIFGDYYLKPYWKYNYLEEVKKINQNKRIKLFKSILK